MAAGPEWERSGCGDEAVGQAHPYGCMRVNTSRVFEEHHCGDYLRAAGYHTGCMVRHKTRNTTGHV